MGYEARSWKVASREKSWDEEKVAFSQESISP